MTKMDANGLLEPGGSVKPGTLDVLLGRMQGKSDFPALSEAIGAINRIASSDKEGVNSLSNNILKDFALTHKLLRLANVAYYNQVGGGTISTISRAVVILGFDAVRSIALSLILLDNLKNKVHAQLLKEAFIKVLYASMLARELAEKTRLKDAEEAFIGGMLHNLGSVLAMFYFPEETVAIKQLVQSEALSEPKAAIHVLGVSYETLGMEIARRWGFPEHLVSSMRALPEGAVKKCTNDAERLRMLAGFANELCEIILATPDADRTQALTQLSTRYADSLPVTQTQLAKLMEKSMQDIAQFARVVNVNLKQSAFAQQASKWVGMALEPEEADSAESPEDAEAASRAALDATVLHEHASILDAALDDASGTPRTPEQIQSILTAGLQDVSNSLIDDKVSLNDILRMILEAMYTGMGFGHVVLCIKDGRHNAMCGKFGFGDDVQGLIKAFNFSLAGPPDVFLVSLQNNADILITDIDDPKIASRIPAWFRRHLSARTFVLLPIIVKGKPIGLIYADCPHPNDISISEKELSLLKSLRNQAVLAIRQSL
jgi:HD-like signal output (HDOD) protein